MGPYEILALIGEGGMGEVWKARDPRLDRVVAIKRLKDKHSARFEQEARAIAALNHPHICQIYDIGPDYLVLEYVEGKPLSNPLPAEEAVRLAIQIASALEEAHRRGILHSDLKPANILVTFRGTAKLLDFGLAKLMTDSDAEATKTMESTVAGTPAYMAPEQAQGKPLDERSDVFSFGAVLYEMVSGRRAFSGSSVVEVLSAIVRDEPRPLPGSPKIARIVMRCLRKRPTERFQNMAEIKAALGLVAAKAVEQQPSIAVLPFANMSRTANDEYFSDGLTEEILNMLAHIQGLRVIARTSSFAFRGKEQDITKIAEALHVGTILEGSVRRVGSRVRVTAQLIDAMDGSNLWSERYDCEMMDVFGVQDDIATAIAGALQVKLMGKPARPHQPNLRAYEALLKGRHQMVKSSPEAWARAREHFEQSIALDPNYAEPHAELGYCFFNLGFWGLRPPIEAMPLARIEARRALELSPADPVAHTVLCVIAALFDGDWKEAEHHYRLGLAADPVLPIVRARRFYYLVPQGRFEEAVEEIETALEQDPLNVPIRSLLSLSLSFAGMYDRAIMEARRALEIDEKLWVTYWVIGQSLALQRMFAEAREPAETAFHLAQWHPMAMGTLAGILACLGEQGLADQLLVKLPEGAPAGRVIYHLLRSEIDAAADWYEKEIELRQPTAALWSNAGFVKPLRESPRWLKLANMMNLPEARGKHSFTSTISV